MAEARRAHPANFAAAEFPGIFRAAFADCAAGNLGVWPDPGICPHSIWHRRTRATEPGAPDIRAHSVSQRGDLLHARIWRYPAHNGRSARAFGDRIRDGFCVSGFSGGVYPVDLL